MNKKFLDLNIKVHTLCQYQLNYLNFNNSSNYKNWSNGRFTTPNEDLKYKCKTASVTGVCNVTKIYHFMILKGISMIKDMHHNIWAILQN